MGMSVQPVTHAPFLMPRALLYSDAGPSAMRRACTARTLESIMSSRTLFAVFLLVVAPVGAVVIVSALLLFGVAPRVVFAPGWAILSLLRQGGLHAPNAVGVAGTVALWWFLLAAIGWAWERRTRDRERLGG